MTPHKWQFTSRFRRRAFGWRSDTPIQRIKEALAEIKAVARKDPVLAAQGAISLLARLSPALEQVDSSSGAIGSAVNRAIDALVPVIAGAQVDTPVRRRWLQQLWQALMDDDIPYLEALGDSWGELCVTPALAGEWADELQPLLEENWARDRSERGYFTGTSVCLASMFAAGRHEELLALLERAPFKWWHDRRWGVQALVAMGKKAQALQYALATRDGDAPNQQVAQACEAILLSSGLADEAYRQYAIEANQGTTHLASFRAIARKYPDMSPETILRDLVAAHPGNEGKWFAAAKDAGLFDLAIELANTSPTDPRTLTRAARDFATSQPRFAMAAGLAALYWMARGHGYELTGLDVTGAYTELMRAAAAAGADAQAINAQVRQMVQAESSRGSFMQTALARYLPP